MKRAVLLLLLCFLLALPVFGQRAGPFNLTATSQCATIQVSSGTSSTVAINVSGTWSDTLQPEVIIASQAPSNVQVTPSTSTTAQGTITANGIYQAAVAGVDTFKVCSTAHVSGTAVVYLNVSTGVAINLLGGGGGGGGGSVTSITATFPLTGGTITTTGSIGLTDPLPYNWGGTSTSSLLAGLVRGGNPFTAAELSGDALTSGSNAVTVQGLENVPFCTGFTPLNNQTLQYTTASSPNPCYTAAIPSGTISGLTTNIIPKASSSTTIADGSMTDTGLAPVVSPLGLDVFTQGGYDYEVPNSSVIGTANLTLTCDDGTGKAVICPSTSSVSNVPIGFSVTGSGTTGNVVLCNLGWCQVYFDNATTARHYAIESTTTPGYLHDNGTALVAGQSNYFIFSANAGANTPGYIRMLIADDFVQSSPSAVYTLQVNAANLPAGDKVNFNNTTPVAPTNGLNITWATSRITSPPTDRVSAAIVGDGNATHALLGTGVFGAVSPSGAAGGDLGGTYPNPTVVNLSHVTNSSLANSGLVNPFTTVNSQTCTLGSPCTIPFQTNGTNNISEAGVNFHTSTTNAVGLTVTPANSTTNQERMEVTGNNYTGNAATSTQFQNAPTQCPGGEFSTGIMANGDPNCSTPAGSGLTGSGTANMVTKWTGTTALGNTQMTDDGSDPVLSPNGFNVSTNGNYNVEVPNDPSTGTIPQTAACNNGSQQAITCPSASSLTNVPIGFTGAGTGTTGNVTICALGFCPVLMDNSALAGDYAIGSPITDGYLHDNGSVIVGGQANFYIWASNSGPGTAAIISRLNPNDFIAGGGGFANPMTTLGDLIDGGASGIANRLAGPTSPNSVPQYLCSVPSGGLATLPAWCLQGVPLNPQSGTTYTVLPTDRTLEVDFNNASPVAVTLPQAGTAGYDSNFVFTACDIGAGTATITPTVSTISYTTGSSYTSAASSLALTTGQCATIESGDNINYNARSNTAPGGMVYPGAGIPVSTGSAWGSSLSETDGDIIAGISGAWAKTTALPNGITATTQSAGDSSADVATDAFVNTAVNNAIAGVNPAVAVLAASTASLTGTYVQVGGGVGDTFTITATGAFSLDGIAINTIGQRVLLKNQGTASQNGVYTASVVGTTGVSPVFTRAADYDTPADVNNTGIVPVQSGTANGDTSWLLTSQVTSIGSAGSALTYTQFSLNPTTIVTAASAATATSQTCVSSGSSKTCTYIDFPDQKFIPAANCNNTSGGNGWSIGSGGTVNCRTGTNNLGGYISISDTSSTFATFQIAIPEDWDTASNPYIRFQLASTDATNAHTIIPSIQVACYKGDGSTTDDVAANAAHSLSTVTLNGNASRFWSSASVQMNSTDMTGCVAGALMQITVGRATDTATNAEFYSATITFPRLLTVQAN